MVVKLGLSGVMKVDDWVDWKGVKLVDVMVDLWAVHWVVLMVVELVDSTE